MAVVAAHLCTVSPTAWTDHVVLPSIRRVRVSCSVVRCSPRSSVASLSAQTSIAHARAARNRASASANAAWNQPVSTDALCVPVLVATNAFSSSSSRRPTPSAQPVWQTAARFTRPSR
jgi:hypothetical protein